MKNQRYKLLTTIIVSALHPNEPNDAGTVWEPVNVIDIQEAKALVQAGYAEETSDTKTPLASTVLERQDAARKAKEAADRGEELPKQPVSTNDEDEKLSLILSGNVEQVRAELEGLTSAQLLRLDELEGDAEQGGKQRKGVAEAIAEAYEQALEREKD